MKNNHVASGFQTDTGISQTSGSKERTLEMWTGDEPADQSMSLDCTIYFD